MTGAPTFFRTPDDLRQWFAQYAARGKELLVGFYKRGSDEASITWPESVDEALCVGWIDGVRRGVDERSYTIRFTPRRPGSIWSAVNIARVAALSAEGRMQPAGLAAFAARKEARSVVYAYEQEGNNALPEPYAGSFRANAGAWPVLRGAGAVVSQDDGLVGGEREARGNARQTAGKAHRGIGGGTADAVSVSGRDGSPSRSQTVCPSTAIFR